jgi:hypothetical protein
MSRRLPIWLVLGLILILPASAAYLQDQTCPPLVERALTEAGNQCADLPRNSACYGFNQVSARFTAEVAETFFSRPADLSELTSIEAINTAALDESLGRWGVAVLNVQANVPNSLPGQGVRFILFGDVALENAVPAGQALLPVTPVEVTVRTRANIRSGPSTRTNVLAGIDAGTVLAAEGINPAADWVLVNAGQVGLGWIFRDLISTAGDLGSLPLVTEQSRSPMQAFQFRTGLGRLSCDAAPAALVVQGPENFKVSITANSADITLGSTIVLRTTDDRMHLYTIDGEAEVDDIRIPAGYTADAPLDEAGQAGTFENLGRISAEDLLDLGWLNDIPAELTEYEIEVPTFDEVDDLATEPIVDTGNVDCSRFRASSPLDGARFSQQAFFWDPAPGATSYRLSVAGLGSVEVPASQTTTTFDLSGLGEAFSMIWFVEALDGGAVACRSQTVTIPREAPPPMQASWSCLDFDGNFVINWQDLPPGSTSLRFNLPGNTANGFEIASPPSSGSQAFNTSSSISGASITAFPTGRTVSLPGSLACFVG